jgi:hypothetical protein
MSGKRWEGPLEKCPRAYLGATDEPATDRDAAHENLKDSEKQDLGDVARTRSDTS